MNLLRNLKITWRKFADQTKKMLKLSELWQEVCPCFLK